MMQHMLALWRNELDDRHHSNIVIGLYAILTAATLASEPMHVFGKGGHVDLGDLLHLRSPDDFG